MTPNNLGFINPKIGRTGYFEKPGHFSRTVFSIHFELVRIIQCHFSASIWIILLTLASPIYHYAEVAQTECNENNTECSHRCNMNFVKYKNIPDLLLAEKYEPLCQGAIQNNRKYQSRFTPLRNIFRYRYNDFASYVTLVVSTRAHFSYYVPFFDNVITLLAIT